MFCSLGRNEFIIFSQLPILAGKRKEKQAKRNCPSWKMAKERVTQTLPPTYFWRWLVAIYLPPLTLFCLKAFFHSSQFCRFTSLAIKVSTIAFQLLPVWVHSPQSIYPSHSVFFSAHVRPPTPPSRCSSQRVSTPLAVTSMLSGLAGERRQPAGGGPGLPECVSTLPSHWHRLTVMAKCWYAVKTGQWGAGMRGEGASLCGFSHRWVKETLTIWTAWIGLCSPSYKPETWTDFTSCDVRPPAASLACPPTHTHKTTVCSFCTCADEELGLSDT